MQVEAVKNRAVSVAAQLIGSALLALLLALWLAGALLADYARLKQEFQNEADGIADLLVSMLDDGTLASKASFGNALLDLSAVTPRCEAAHAWISTAGGDIIKLAGDPGELVHVQESGGGRPGTHGVGGYRLAERPLRLDAWSGQTLEAPRLTLAFSARPDAAKEFSRRAWAWAVIFIMGLALLALLRLLWWQNVRSKAMAARIQADRRRRGQFEELALAAAGMAHEVKNPLGIIRGLAQQIHNLEDLPETCRGNAADIMEEADITTARLGDFLSYARIRKPEPRPLAAKAHLGRIVGLVADDFARAGVELSTNLDDLQIIADPEMLSQVLLNLLTNALKSCSEGKRVAVELASRGKTAQLSVFDTGEGMAAEDQQNIFKPYFTKRQGGYGIGLAIVKRIVDSSNWEINVDSKPGGGTSMTILGIELAES